MWRATKVLLIAQISNSSKHILFERHYFQRECALAVYGCYLLFAA